MNIKSALYSALSLFALSSALLSGGVLAKDLPGSTQTSYAVSPSGAFQFSELNQLGQSIN